MSGYLGLENSDSDERKEVNSNLIDSTSNSDTGVKSNEDDNDNEDNKIEIESESSDEVGIICLHNVNWFHQS